VSGLGGGVDGNNVSSPPPPPLPVPKTPTHEKAKTLFNFGALLGAAEQGELYCQEDISPDNLQQHHNIAAVHNSATNNPYLRASKADTEVRDNVVNDDGDESDNDDPAVEVALSTMRSTAGRSSRTLKPSSRALAVAASRGGESLYVTSSSSNSSHASAPAPAPAPVTRPSYAIRPPPEIDRSEHKRLTDAELKQATDDNCIALAMEDYRAKKHLLLDMALSRDNPRNLASNPRPGVIKDGFFWGSYPALEKVLRQSMDEYYELSTAKRQSKEQQMFNNRLVTQIRDVASSNGWVFDPLNFDEKKVRDRIRCFFKTHIQNAKKRLKTVVKNQHKRTNKLLVIAAKEAIRCVLEGVEYSHNGLLGNHGANAENGEAGAAGSTDATTTASDGPKPKIVGKRGAQDRRSMSIETSTPYGSKRPKKAVFDEDAVIKGNYYNADSVGLRNAHLARPRIEQIVGSGGGGGGGGGYPQYQQQQQKQQQQQPQHSIMEIADDDQGEAAAAVMSLGFCLSQSSQQEGVM
jgi:hypothetical protein